ncbi:myosin-9-like [Bidens hawaiensis]|uniref:myosin-9-like n=1 Tax=Bidens hawaiensis TaxID=980011 RepID=UPI00404B5AB6
MAVVPRPKNRHFLSYNSNHRSTDPDDNNVLAYWLSNASTLLVQASRTRRSDEHWQKIVNNNGRFLDLLNNNNVPPFLICKIFTQIFSYLNVKLFNSLMLRLELYSIGNGEYVETGLSQLEQWCYKATEKYVGSAWYELKHIKYAIGFLVIQDKSRKTLNEISDDLCPILNIQQLYKICTWFFDDKYRNRGVAPHVISTMKGLKEDDYVNGDVRTPFLLDDDLSIPFSVDDFSKSMDQINITNIELPPLVLEHLGLDFMLSRVDS